jgi:dethiobiotin synthetase
MTLELFVAGTDTGVGKTLVAAALVRLARQCGLAARGLKPVASGAARTPEGLRNEDALTLQLESTPPIDYATVNPYCFEPAIAPHLAAADRNAAVELPALAAWYRRASSNCDAVIVEGAGGWRVPLHPRGFLSDLPETLGLPVLLVVGLRLGCLNHARLTYEAIVAAGRCRFAGWIGNSLDAAFERSRANVETLARLLDSPPLAVLPPLAPPSVDAAARVLEGSDRLTRLFRTA